MTVLQPQTKEKRGNQHKSSYFRVPTFLESTVVRHKKIEESLRKQAEGLGLSR